MSTSRSRAEQARLVLEVCLGQHAFQLLEVCRLSTVNQPLKSLIDKELIARKHRLARKLLGLAVRQCSITSDAKAISQLGRGVQWLLTHPRIPSDLVSEEAPALLSIPNVPLAVIEQLVAAGIRISYEQLATAARSQLEGVHNWVVAGLEADTPISIPWAAELVCCMQHDGGRSIHELSAAVKELTMHELVDCFHITLNTLPGSFLWQGTVLPRLMSAPAAAEISEHAAQHLLEAAMTICMKRLSRHRSYSVESCMYSMLKLPAINSLGTSNTVKLLAAAFETGVPLECVTKLYDTLPAAKQLNNQQLQTLLQAAVPAAVAHHQEVCGSAQSYATLVCQWMPQGWRMGCESWADLNKMYRSAISALNTGSCSTPVFKQLSGLNFTAAAGAVPAHAVLQLFKHAIDTFSSKKVGREAVHSCLEGLQRLPASQQVSVIDRGQLMSYAANSKAWYCVAWLLEKNCDIGDTAGRDSAIAKMLHSAVNEGDTAAISMLACKHLVRELTHGHAAELVGPAVELLLDQIIAHGKEERDQQQRLTPGGAKPSNQRPSTIVELIYHFVDLHPGIMTLTLVEKALQASAAEVSSSDRALLLLLHTESPLETRASISVGVMAEAVLVAARTGADVAYLCQQPAAARLGAAVVAEALRMAIAAGDPKNVLALGGLPGAVDVSADATADMLQAALSGPESSSSMVTKQQKQSVNNLKNKPCIVGRRSTCSSDYRAVDYLCGLSLASSTQIKPTRLLELLGLAVAHGDCRDLKALIHLPQASQIGCSAVVDLMGGLKRDFVGVICNECRPMLHVLETLLAVQPENHCTGD